MVFRYRYVAFGTNFASRSGVRSQEIGGRSPETLYDNELVVDVGGTCWGFGREEQSVIDHHFQREGQFPSAASAVLHCADRIRSKFTAPGFDLIWLVTHGEPDFDAFCAMYLARQLIEDPEPAHDLRSSGVHPDGWIDIGSDPERKLAGGPKINWFDPDLRLIPTDQRWRIMLAANASLVDNSRRLHCPQNRALHSVLYAALKRGRDYLNDHSGAVEFFEEVRHSIDHNGLNPLFDSVLEGNATFAPELRLLDRELDAYKRDIQRARKVLVHVQQSDVPFPVVFDRLRRSPLFQQNSESASTTRSPERAEMVVDSLHLAPADQSRSQTDGIYLRDPECLIFKEWARLDVENSSMGKGFLFTAVAYSNGRPAGTVNTTDYFFAIDPEKAGGRHLYTLWARLQRAEIIAFEEATKPHIVALNRRLRHAERETETTSTRTICRHGFENRAGPFAALFDDPWFDGSNYGCTLVATPNRGSLIGEPGTQADLLDDPVTAIVRSELEQSIYASASVTEPPKVAVRDYDCSSGDQVDTAKSEQQYSIEDVSHTVPPPSSGCFRFAEISLNEHVDILSGGMAAQIGETLWRILHPDRGAGTPSDFHDRHLLITNGWVGVWSRRGIAVARKPAAEKDTGVLKARFRELICLNCGVESFRRDVKSSLLGDRSRIHDVVGLGENLTLQAAEIERVLTLPDAQILSRLFDAIRLDEGLETLQRLNRAVAEQVRRKMSDEQTKELATHTRIVADVQAKVEWLEVFIVAFYATELMASLTDHSATDHTTLALKSLVGLIVLGGTALVLQPWEHTESKWPLAILAVLSLIYLVAAYFGIRQAYAEPYRIRAFLAFLLVLGLSALMAVFVKAWVRPNRAGRPEQRIRPN